MRGLPSHFGRRVPLPFPRSDDGGERVDLGPSVSGRAGPPELATPFRGSAGFVRSAVGALRASAEGRGDLLGETLAARRSTWARISARCETRLSTGGGEAARTRAVSTARAIRCASSSSSTACSSKVRTGLGGGGVRDGTRLSYLSRRSTCGGAQGGAEGGAEAR